MAPAARPLIGSRTELPVKEGTLADGSVFKNLSQRDLVSRIVEIIYYFISKTM